MTNKVICLFVHYYDKNSAFEGRSKHQVEELRRGIVRRALSALQSIRGMDVRVCGFPERHLVPIDIDMSTRTADPQLMMYEALAALSEYRDDYDYFMVVEDDILVGPDVLNNVFEFDAQFGVNQIFLPNRIEIHGRRIWCVDTYWMPGKTGDAATFNGRGLRVFKNPHSGLLIVSRKKLDYLITRVDAKYRGKVVGGFMASAFAYYHQPFKLYRIADGYDFHTVMHLDRYTPPKLTPFQVVRGLAGRLVRRFV